MKQRKQIYPGNMKHSVVSHQFHISPIISSYAIELRQMAPTGGFEIVIFYTYHLRQIHQVHFYIDAVVSTQSTCSRST